LPLFEVEGDRPQIVPGPRPGVGTTAHRVVESHIDGLLGEQIFPVSPGVGPDEPHLLALDASGAPVVVELVSRLDDAALSRALDHAGAAGRMTRGQLASLYAAGPQAFQRDVAEFYDSVPITRSAQGRPGVRLIVICQDADDDVLNAVDFLRQPSMPVEVLRLGLVHGADGRRFVDVSPLVIHPASAPDRPELVGRPEGVKPLTALNARPADVVQEPARIDAVPLPGVSAPVAPAEPARPRTAPTPVGDQVRQHAAPTAVPPPPAPTPPVVRRRSRTDRFSAPATPVAGNPVEPPVPAPPFEPPAPAAFPPLDDVARRQYLPYPPTDDAAETTSPAPAGTDDPDRFSSGLDLGPSSPHEDPLAWRPQRSWSDDPVVAPTSAEREAVAFGEVFSGISNPLDPDWDPNAASSGRVPWEPPYEPPRLDEPSLMPTPAPWWEPDQHASAPTPMVLDDDDDADLAALAAALGVPTALTWERPRRGQRFDALLLPDGTIELPDGGRYRHPDIAASAASGSYTADGWTVWRLQPTGETLSEAFRARFA
jgi:hypothetical protein